MKLFIPLNRFIFIMCVFPFAYPDPPKVALNPGRLKLLEDALSWLTLRIDGKLLTPDQSNEFTTTLHEEYNNSLYFRTIVIAFQLGVLPKLTLQQGQPCDPAYTLRYRSELNNSVTWYKVKNFTLESYYDLKKPGSPSDQYCDYRKGLVCIPTTKKCDCPEGSKMQPIEANSQVQRCLIEEDEFCPMPDLITYRNIGAFLVKLTELIFNLEKPQSCKHGTTCRVKDSPFTRCLSTSKAPFENKAPAAKYGEECLLDYLGEGGGCDVSLKYTFGLYKSSVCFNFWGYLQNKRLSSQSTYKRKGLCAADVAPYITPGIMTATLLGPSLIFDYPFVNGMVNPGTVKMSSSELLDYDDKLCKATFIYNADKKPNGWNPGRKARIQRKVGEPCSVTDTAKMIDMWNFFAGLEKDPSSGQDVVADVPTLQAKLVEYQSLIDNHKDFEPKICRIYWEKASKPNGEETPPLSCVSTTGAAPDANGNDGKCELSNNNDTYAHTLTVHNFRMDDFRSKNEIINKDRYHDKTILKDNPEASCIPSRGKRQSRSRNSDVDKYYDWTDRHVHGVVFEDGTCMEGFGCVEDLSESHEIYKNPKDKKDCSFVEGYQPQFNCLDIKVFSDDAKLRSCQAELLNQKVMDAIQTAPRLAMGAPCSYKLVEEIERCLYAVKINSHVLENRYRMLSQLETIGICDKSKLLECNTGNICACGKHSAPRTTADKKYTSDYCYMTAGPCSLTLSDDDEYDDYGEGLEISLTEADKVELDAHYGTSSSIDKDSCENGNVCKFIDACTSQCIDANSGSTGYDVDVVGGCAPITTTTVKPPNDTTRPLEPVVPFNGAELSLMKKSHLSVAIIMIVILNSFIVVNWS